MASRLCAGFLGIVTLSLGVAGCGGDEPTGPGGDPPPPFIVFASSRATPAGLFRMNLDGSNVQQLTAGGEIFGSVDYNGTVLAISTNAANSEIAVKNLATGTLTTLTTDPAIDYRPSMNKSGTRIAFVSERSGGDRDLWLINTDGSGLVRLTNRSGEDTFPQWSPDGQRVVFTQFTARAQTWVVNINGTGLTNLSNNAFEDSTPSFSPDGTRILFSSNRDGDYDLFTMNPDGSGQTKLFDLAGNEYHASFTPDGTQVVFYSDVTGKSQIMIANVNGSNLRNLSNNSVNEFRTASLIAGGS